MNQIETNLKIMKYKYCALISKILLDVKAEDEESKRKSFLIGSLNGLCSVLEDMKNMFPNLFEKEKDIDILLTMAKELIFKTQKELDEYQ